jgi:hypothetical protein
MGVSASHEAPTPEQQRFETVRTPSSSGSTATIVPDNEANAKAIKFNDKLIKAYAKTIGMNVKELDNQGTQVLTACFPTPAPEYPSPSKSNTGYFVREP